MFQFVTQHQAVILAVISSAGAGRVFASIMRSCPPVGVDAPFLLRWIHDFCQDLAVNQDKKSGAK